MPGFTRLTDLFQLIRETGFKPVLNYAGYKILLSSGLARMLTPSHPTDPGKINFQPSFFIRMPTRQVLVEAIGDGIDNLLKSADDICRGFYKLFGGSASQLNLTPEIQLMHWTCYRDDDPAFDLKLIWEPARFGWAYDLVRAYVITGDARYPEVFWEYFEQFMLANPYNLGPNWISSQEVAIRSMALLFAANCFKEAPSSKPQRMAALTASILDHARRIPATIWYAYAQNNNHLLSEALGLYLSGSYLTNHPSGNEWQWKGWRIFNLTLVGQIHPDGSYIQQSTNYHRLMLHLALIAGCMQQGSKWSYPPKVVQKLSLATDWLLGQIDPASGRAPNLGHQDGSNILPFSPCTFEDFRPVGQAASRLFLGKPFFPPGPWDELSLWLGLPVRPLETRQKFYVNPLIPRLGDEHLWASLRAAPYPGRPAHADQLHVEIWWEGENFAGDPGTYRYTAKPPWDNSLVSTRVHNTVEINHRDQMKRAGRFRWIHHARGEFISSFFGKCSIGASHNGYQQIGLNHQRTIQMDDNGSIIVCDELTPISRDLPNIDAVIHWLLPDWQWSLKDTILSLDNGSRHATVQFSASAKESSVHLARAGKSMLNVEAFPIHGWCSRTYNELTPRISFMLHATGSVPMQFRTVFNLSKYVTQ